MNFWFINCFYASDLTVFMLLILTPW